MAKVEFHFGELFPRVGFIVTNLEAGNRAVMLFHRPLWRKLRTTNVIERCFVEVRRRTRPMVCFVNVASIDRIIYAIFNGMNEKSQWKNRTLQVFTQAA